MRLKIHKQAIKQIQKAPKKIQMKIREIIQLVLKNEFDDLSYRKKSMKGKYKVFTEIILDKDYRLLYRIIEGEFQIRYAGTHNSLGTG